jgi:iron complex outermembrane receptor protein
VRATLFHETTEDGLFSQTNVTVTPNVTNVQNVDRLRTNGVELVAQAQDVGLSGLSLTGSVTYADSRTVQNDKFPASVGKWQPRVPRWRASLVGTWQANDRLSATLGARYGGFQYSTLDNSDPNGFAYQGASKFFTLDARVLWRFDRQWSAALGIDNLNNTTYWNFHPYPQRTFSAELKFDL